MCRVDPADLGQQGTVDRLLWLSGRLAKRNTPARRPAHRTWREPEDIALIFDETKFHLVVLRR